MTITAQETDRDEWLAWRGKGIGASDIGALLGLSNFASPWSLWAQKVGLVPPSEHTQRQRIGLRMEKVLAEEFHDETGLYVAGEQTWFTHPQHPVLRCTADGLVVESESSGIDDALGTWQAKTDAQSGWPDGVPPYIKAQCIYEMGVAGLSHCWLTVMFARFRVEHFEIPFDVADWRFMQDRALTFWRDHVLTGTPPETDDSDATAKAIGAVWPEHIDGATRELGALFADQFSTWQELGEIKSKAEKERQGLRSEIAAHLQDAEVGTFDGVPVLTYRQQKGRTSTCPECGHTETAAPSRVLRPAPKGKK